jgi:hypothetical protein
MDRHLVVLGTDHALQGSENIPVDKKINDPTYRVLVEKLIKDYYVDCIFEEASGCGPTTASKVKRTGVEYFDVDPPGPERKSNGIPEGLLIENYAIYEINAPHRPRTEPFATQKKLDTELGRERVWVERIHKQHFKNGLMICGAAHTFSVARRLVDSGFSVDVIVYMGPTLIDLIGGISAGALIQNL